MDVYVSIASTEAVRTVGCTGQGSAHGKKYRELDKRPAKYSGKSIIMARAHLDEISGDSGWADWRMWQCRLNHKFPHV
jgi:hypothetical protein